MIYFSFFTLAVFLSADVNAIDSLSIESSSAHRDLPNIFNTNQTSNVGEKINKGACGPGCRRIRNRKKKASRAGMVAVERAVRYAKKAEKAKNKAAKMEDAADKAQKKAKKAAKQAEANRLAGEKAAREGNFEAAKRFAAAAAANASTAKAAAAKAAGYRAKVREQRQLAAIAANNAAKETRNAKKFAKAAGSYASRIDLTKANNAVKSARDSVTAANTSLRNTRHSIAAADANFAEATASTAALNKYIKVKAAAKYAKDRADNLEAFKRESKSRAADKIDLKPPPGDLSILFLGNMFGVVDGVLAGTGSQITGQMFGVFNAAVLTLAGIMLSYTLLISTMNSAQEGTFIGQKWSSVWVPTRTVAGAMLILPKASGYCAMQIFIMWIVVQGVGAADKVWSQALAYLNRGGSIIRPNVDPITGMNQGGNSQIFNGAYGIYVGQICMIALEKSMVQYQNSLKTSNTCSDAAEQSPGGYTDVFCSTPVPNFMNTINFLSPVYLQQSSPTISMPDFPEVEGINNPYFSLNGMCGYIKYNNFSLDDNLVLTSVPDKDKGEVAYEESKYAQMGISRSEIKTIDSSRAVALHQMFLFLSTVSNKVIGNAPFLSGVDCNPSGACVDNYAEINLGVPLTIDLQNCYASTNVYSADSLSYKSNACLSWDSENGMVPILLKGPEIQDAVSTYNGMMTASLYIQSQLTDTTNYKKQRAFIDSAEQTGWILAGAYYFRLAILTSQVLESSNSSVNNDSTSGLEVCTPNDPSSCGKGAWSISDFADGFESDICLSDYQEIKNLFCNDGSPDYSNSFLTTMIVNINTLINGNDATYPTIPEMTQNQIQQPTYGNSKYGFPNSAYGWLVNSSAIALPGQPGSSQPEFVMKTTFNASTNVPQLGNSVIRGGKWNIPGEAVTFIFNNILKVFFNMLFSLVIPMINMMFFMFLQPPLILLSSVFLGAMKVLDNVNINPILGLTNMGVGLIEGALSSFILMLSVAVMATLLPGALGLLMMLLPVVVLWLGIMVTVGIMATFYLPFVPFTIFLFATLGWFIGVIEVMVAAPLIALGIMHPDGDQVFGKGEQSVILLLGIFLRPAMMILGYIFGIILSYVSIWFLNAGFSIIIPDVQNMQMIDLNTGVTPAGDGIHKYQDTMSNLNSMYAKGVQKVGSAMTGDTSIYGMWSTIYLIFFVMLAYISSIITAVSKAFELIHYVPDKVMRWISGGSTEDLGGKVANAMSGDMKSAHKKASKATSDAASKTAAKSLKLAMKAAKPIMQVTSAAGQAASSAVTGKESDSKDQADQLDAAIEDAGNLNNNSKTTANTKKQRAKMREKKNKGEFKSKWT